MSQTQNQRGLHSQALDLLRFPLAVLVVLEHVFPNTTGFEIVGKPFDFTNFPVFSEVLVFVRAFIRWQNVPIFYLISGYVFFLGIKLTREVYLRKIKSRARTLLQPYIIWNAATLAVLFLTHSSILRQHLPANPDASFHPTISNLLSSFWASPALLGNDTTGPVNIALWFVRDLIVVVLCTPLLDWLIRKFKHWFIIALGLLWLCPNMGKVEDFFGFPTALFFFSWGAYLSIFQKDVLTDFGRFFKPSLILYPCLGILGMVSLHCFPEAVTTFIKQLNVLAGLMLAYNTAVWLLRSGRCKVSGFLSSASFFIYVSHMLICARLRTLLYVMFKPAGDFGIISVHVAALALTVGVLLAVYWTMQRYTPALLRLLTGRK